MGSQNHEKIDFFGSRVEPPGKGKSLKSHFSGKMAILRVFSHFDQNQGKTVVVLAVISSILPS